MHKVGKQLEETRTLLDELLNSVEIEKIFEEFSSDTQCFLKTKTNINSIINKLDDVSNYFPFIQKLELRKIKNQIRVAHELLISELSLMRNALIDFKKIKNPNNESFLFILFDIMDRITIQERIIVEKNSDLLSFIEVIDDVEIQNAIMKKIQESTSEFKRAEDLKVFLSDVGKKISETDLSLLKSVSSFSVVVTKIFLYALDKKNNEDLQNFVANQLGDYKRMKLLSFEEFEKEMINMKQLISQLEMALIDKNYDIEKIHKIIDILIFTIEKYIKSRSPNFVL